MSSESEARAQQAELYGAPLGDIARQVMGALGLNQGGLAEVLGLSAPMLSQLMSAKRVKIGNPAVVGRFQALLELAASPPSTPQARDAALEAVRASAPTMSSTSGVAAGRATLVQGLRALAAPAELGEAAARLADIPALSSLLAEAARGGGPARG